MQNVPSSDSVKCESENPGQPNLARCELGSEMDSLALKDQLKQQSLEWLTDYGDTLFSYALRRVASPDLAEELVQEAFLGAIRNRDSFSGDAKPKTWLISILRHKIADHYRKKTRVRSLEHAFNPPVDQFESDGDSQSTNAEKPIASKQWTDPTLGLSESELQCVLRECIAELPDLVRQAFEFRFFDQMELDEVCEVQEISRNNLAARMYRARKYLRQCLDHRWF